MSAIVELDRRYPALFGEVVESEGEGDSRDGEHPFTKQYGWIYQVKLISEYEGIPLAHAYELPVIQFLNGLAYLKAKNTHEDYLRKKASGKTIY